MSKFKVDISGINTNSLKVLTNEENINLFKAKMNGNKDASEQIINGNLKLVLSLVSKYRHKDIDMNDLFQAGCIGLIKAVNNFDLSFGVMFSTYAVPLILGEIKRYIRCNTSLRIARSIRDNAYNILKYKEEYLRVYGNNPTILEISKALKLSEYDIRLSLGSLEQPLSMEKPIYDSKDNTLYLMDEIPLENSIDSKKEDLIALRDALKGLSSREREVILLRYIIGATQSEVADKLSVSQAQVSRIEKSALNKARKLIS